MDKERLDVLLVNKGFFNSRQKAKAAIMAGKILVGGKKIDKAGTLIHQESEINIIGEKLPFVSRGGLKLKKALEIFNLNLQGKVLIDVGASTGGFTDCALQSGAAKVIAIDVGYGQLAWKLRQDPRVKLLERTNIRYVRDRDLGELADLITVDVSFISLKLVLPVIIELAKPKADFIILIKPQFEAGREKVGKHGVVKDPLIHVEVIQEIIKYADRLNFVVKSLDYSPIKGPQGNIEYLLWLSNQGEENNFTRATVSEVVNNAHTLLNSL